MLEIKITTTTTTFVNKIFSIGISLYMITAMLNNWKNSLRTKSEIFEWKFTKGNHNKWNSISGVNCGHLYNLKDDLHLLFLQI